MNYTSGVLESLNKIFGGVLFGAITKDNIMVGEIVKTGKINLNRFIGNFPSNIFQDEYAVFYDILKTSGMRFFSVAQLDEILDRNRDLVLDSPYIDLSKYSTAPNGNMSTPDEQLEAFKRDIGEMLVELSNTFVDEEAFNSACLVYIDWFKDDCMLRTATNMAAMMQGDGIEIRRPGKRKSVYRGFEDAKRYYNEEMALLNEISAENRIRTVKLDSEWLKKEEELENSGDADSILDTGIEEIDNYMGGSRRGHMLGILGPPKGGKTRFSNYLAQRALDRGLNVCVWPLEGSVDEWVSNQIACRIAVKSAQEAASDGIIRLDSKKILRNEYRNIPQIRKEIASTRAYMAVSENYGRLTFIEGAAYCEDFIDVLKAHYNNENPFDVLIIDSLVNILSHSRKPKNERISDAYMALKNALEHEFGRPVLGIMPAQLKQEVVDYLRSNPDETIDVTAGGESAETIRTPDDVIGLFSSKEERAANLMRIYSVASRHSLNFPDFMARCYLECCYFAHLDQ